ncbi:MAG: hypothetical protein AAFV53_16015 [Myxococcota bacterium]
MQTIGDGTWGPDAIQDRRWRRVVADVADRQRPMPSRIKSARKILRDGNDLLCCVFFNICRIELPNQPFTPAHPFAPVLGAMRFRALRILGRPSKLQRRDYLEATAILPWVIKPRDTEILARFLIDPKTSVAELTSVLDAFLRIVDGLPMDERILNATVNRAQDVALPAPIHERLSQILQRWEGPRRSAVLRGLAERAVSLGQRWPYLRAFAQVAPDEGRAVLEEILNDGGALDVWWTETIHAVLSPES